MKKLYKYIITAWAISVSLNIYAQNKGYQCDFDRIMKERYIIQSDYLKSVQSQNQFNNKYLKNIFIPNSGKTAQVKKIPIVFHVIHEFGSENISDAIVLTYLDRMNKHYRKQDADTSQIAAPFDLIHDDMEIEFVLAKKDPNGDCTTGITRTVSSLSDGGGDGVKSLIRWPNNMYLNVWIVRSTGNGSGGYSFLPGISNNLDGIVILAYQLSALAHEAGHWLGLPHLWGGTNNSNLISNCTSDDGIADTPNTQGQGGCNTSRNSCGDSPIPFNDIFGNEIWPAINGEVQDNCQNYMDYGFCSAENFTQGQKAICQATLQNNVNGRNNLWTDSNLLATGINDGFSCLPIPIADFAIISPFGCVGNNITLQNNSYNGDNLSYNWEFTDGNPATSTLKNPSVYWKNAGAYSVKLKVYNANGSDSLTKENIITLTKKSSIIAPFYESFESSDFPKVISNSDLDWLVLHSNFTPTTWDINNTASTNGSKSISIDCKKAIGIHNLISPSFDFSTSNCNSISFDVAYARRSKTTFDILKVYTSVNCGQSWKETSYNKSGADLETGKPLPYDDFIPLDDEWRTETIDLSQYNSKSNLMLKFELDRRGGNYIYIDNLNVGCSDTSIKNKKLDFDIHPNPSTANFIFDNFTKKNEYFNIEVVDAFGRIVLKDKSIISGRYLLNLENETSGVYFVRISSKTESVKVKKIVLQRGK